MLSDTIQSYLTLRRALGVSYEVAEVRLRSFARFAAGRGDNHVRAETAIAWARSSSSAQERNQRLRTVARFSRHARALDNHHEVPPAEIFAHPYLRPTPYIFSRADIQRLVAEARLLLPADSLRPLTYSTLFALLATTGLRIGEALALRLEDLTVDGLVVRKSKLRKSRLLPLHESTVAGVQRYLRRRLDLSGKEDHFFVDLDGQRLAYARVRCVFRRLIGQLGLRRGPAQPTPRLHSLRHTFAVRALESCPCQREHVGRHLVALSTYLGHSSVANTYWYLEATAQLLGDISTACASFRKEVAR